MSELPPEYRRKHVRNDDGSYSTWETHDGENWVQVLVPAVEKDNAELPHKSETWFTEHGATTIDHWDDGSVTAERYTGTSRAEG